MTHVSRRTMLFASSTLLTGAALLAATGCSTTTTTPTTPTAVPTIASDATLLANALAALEPLIPSAAQAVYAQVVAAATTVAKDATTLLTATGTTATNAGTEILSLISTIGPAIVGLFPGGGTAVTIIQAAISLAPELASLLGLASYAKSSVASVMPPTLARGVLAGLPRSPHFGT